MLERYVTALRTDDAGAETPAETRDRLRDHFARGATRRMTQLGMLIGAQVKAVEPQPHEALVYLSAYAETRALEGYLESFPTASPTLFQTSIHPSAIQQVMIGQHQPLRHFFPMAGSRHGIAQALTVALLGDPAAPTLVCGGEERGTWLLEQNAASDRTFGFVFRLSANATNALARVRLSPEVGYPVGTCPLPQFFDTLVARRPLTLGAPSGARLTWDWLAP